MKEGTIHHKVEEKSNCFYFRATEALNQLEARDQRETKESKKKSLEFIHVSAGDDAAHVFLLGARKKKSF